MQRLNGWQRLWVLVGGIYAAALLLWVLTIPDGGGSSTGDIIVLAVVWVVPMVVLYGVGWTVAWVIRGFRPRQGTIGAVGGRQQLKRPTPRSDDVNDFLRRVFDTAIALVFVFIGIPAFRYFFGDSAPHWPGAVGSWLMSPPGWLLWALLALLVVKTCWEMRRDKLGWKAELKALPGSLLTAAYILLGTAVFVGFVRWVVWPITGR